jgi:hypothetical protein
MELIERMIHFMELFIEVETESDKEGISIKEKERTTKKKVSKNAFL